MFFGDSLCMCKQARFLFSQQRRITHPCQLQQLSEMSQRPCVARHQENDVVSCFTYLEAKNSASRTARNAILRIRNMLVRATTFHRVNTFNHRKSLSEKVPKKTLIRVEKLGWRWQHPSTAETCTFAYGTTRVF